KTRLRILRARAARHEPRSCRLRTENGLRSSLWLLGSACERRANDHAQQETKRNNYSDWQSLVREVLGKAQCRRTVERKRVTHQLGDVTTRGKRPPADIKTEAERHMATVNTGSLPADRIVTIGDFVARVYLPWIKEHKRPSTAKGYADIWEDHLESLCGQVWLKDTRTYHVQGWLNQIGR